MVSADLGLSPLRAPSMVFFKVLVKGQKPEQNDLNGFPSRTGVVPQGIIFCVKEKVQDFSYRTFVSVKCQPVCICSSRCHKTYVV